MAIIRFDLIVTSSLAIVPKRSNLPLSMKAFFLYLREFFPLLAEQEQPRKWLQIQADLSLAENTIQAYGKSLEDYLLFCKIYKVIPETAKKADIATYVRCLSHRPNPRGKNIISNPFDYP